MRSFVVRASVRPESLVPAIREQLRSLDPGGLTSILGSVLYGISPVDPAVLAGVASGLGLAALAAGLVPVRRAAAQDPVVTLRSE
jgi:hypothetical protein